MTSGQQAIAFGVCFAAVFALNAALIQMPPVWDAVGVFAPAVHLYESGFDLSGLLALPGYVEGGSNIHSLSLVTFMTLLAMWISGGEPAFFLPGLHVLNFALAALTGSLVFSLSRRLVGTVPAAILTAALLVFPPFLVQSGALHTEMAGAAFVMLGLAAFSSRAFASMVVWVVAGCAVKSLGLVLLAPLAALMLLDQRLTPAARLGWCGALALPVALIEAVKWAAAPAAPGTGRGLVEHLELMWSHLSQVPDLVGLLTLALFALVLAIVRASRMGLELALRDDAERIRLATALVPAACIGFVAVIPLSGADFIPLQRYYVWVLAPMLISIAAALHTISGPRVVAGALVCFVVYAGLNRGGRFYPQQRQPIRRFSVVERSYEYLDYFEAQRQGVRGLAAMAADRPSFTTRGDYYYLSSPLFGWVDRSVRNVHFILAPPYDSGRLADYPSDFFLLESDTNRYHGRAAVLDLIAKASRSPNHQPRLAGEWKSGPYTASLIHIQSIRADASRPDKRAKRRPRQP